MKKIFLAIAIAATCFSCSQKAPEETKTADVKQEKVLTPEQEFQAHLNDLKKKFKRRGSNKDSLQLVYDNYLKEQAKIHLGDSLGLSITQSMASDFDSKQLDSVMNLCERYKNDPVLQELAHASIAAENTRVGRPYIDIAGEDVTTAKFDKKGKDISLSKIIAKGKPVLVNFWSSGSIASRNDMSKVIIPTFDEFEGKVNFLSVAVWEDSITFTHRAISELMIKWPCIYTGGKENSPTEQYGILKIPHVILIGKDGIIKARGIREEEIKAALLKEIGK